MPDISIIIPTFNRELFIGDAIRSVLAQETSRTFEVLVSDDGSTDGTVEVARSFQHTVRVLPSSVNSGAGEARNRGIIAAQSPLIAFLDSDDLMLPGRLEIQASFMDRHSEVGVISAASIHESGEPPEDYYHNRGLEIPMGEWLVLEHPRPAVTLGYIVHSSTMMARRAVLLQGGLYDPGLVTLEDWEFLIRLASITQFACYNSPLAWIRNRTSSDRLAFSPIGALKAPGVWEHLLAHSEDLTNEERIALHRHLDKSLRGAFAAAYNSHNGRRIVRDLLARHRNNLDPVTRVIWFTRSLLPKRVDAGMRTLIPQKIRVSRSKALRRRMVAFDPTATRHKVCR